MNITRKSEGKHAVVLALSGNITGGPDAELFSSTLEELIGEGRKNVLLDLKSVKWVNSTGLGILISGLHKLRNLGGAMKIVNMSDRIDNIFSVTKLNLVFEVFTEEVEALRSFRPAEDASSGKPTS
ncbi:MAG: STAS domain-containing protein [Candidatus Eiseniibacteriota bacterium]|jgi:anti-sigma B factor antagonist